MMRIMSGLVYGIIGGNCIQCGKFCRMITSEPQIAQLNVRNFMHRKVCCWHSLIPTGLCDRCVKIKADGNPTVFPFTK